MESEKIRKARWNLDSGPTLIPHRRFRLTVREHGLGPLEINCKWHPI